MNLTPVEKHDNIYFKRDDLFCPYGDVNGGKVRQTIKLFEKYYKQIKSKQDLFHRFSFPCDHS